MHYAVKPNIGGVDIGRGELSARPLGAASPAVLQLRSIGVVISSHGLMHQAPQKPRGTRPACHLPPTLAQVPPNDNRIELNDSHNWNEEERRCSHVVIDPTQKNEALPPLSL